MRGLEVEGEANAEQRGRPDLDDGDGDEMYLLAAIELDLMRRLGRNHQRLHDVGSGPGLQHFVDHHL